MANKVFNIIIKLVKEGGGDKETVSSLISIKNAMTQGLAVAGAMAGAYYAVDKVIDATVGKFASYAKGVDVFKSAMSTTAEEASRMIQVADDFGISSDEMQTAMLRAVKGGMDPTIAGLAGMADKYNALASPQEKVNFQTKNFGKSSQELTRLLGEGGQAILARSAAVSDSLVLDAAAIRKGREYETAVDDLSDSVLALKIAAGEKGIPILINLITKFTAATSTGAQIVDIQKNITRETYNTLTAGEKLTTVFVGLATLPWGGLTMFKDLLLGINSATTEGIDQGAALQARWEADQAALAGLAGPAEDFASNLKDITGFAKQYETGVQNIATAEGNLKTAEDELAALRKARYREYGKTITEAKQKVNDLTGALSDAKQASMDATSEMIAGFLQTQLTMDGNFSEADMKKVLDYRLAMGLLTQEAYDAALQALQVAQNLAAIPAETYSRVYLTTYTQTIHQKTIEENPGRTYTGYAEGGRFNEDIARVGERGEEWLMRTPGGGVVVLPNDMVRRLEAWGITPGAGFMFGGDAGGSVGATRPPAKQVTGYTPSLLDQQLAAQDNPNSWMIPYLAGSGGAISTPGYTPGSGSGSGSGAVIQAAAVSAVAAVSPVVADAMQGFTATQQASTRENTAQVEQQTRAVMQGNADQTAALRQMQKTLDRLPEKLAAEIVKGKR